MTTTLTLSDLKPGQEYFLDNVRVKFVNGGSGWVHRFELGSVSVGAGNPALAQAAIRPVPREFKVGSEVKAPSWNGHDTGTVRAVCGNLVWVEWHPNHFTTENLSELRHADEVGG